MKQLLLFLTLSTYIGYAQVQIGADIDGEAANDYSASVSLSSDGSIAAIGASFNDGNGPESGHVRVYQNISGVWTQVGDDMDGEAANDRSSIVSLSADGTIVAIGAILNNANGAEAGHVRVYQNISDIWTQVGDDIDGEAAGDWFGNSISLSSDGSIVAIGAPKNDGNGPNSGHVRIYQNISGVWTQIGADIDGESGGNFSGGSVSLSADGTIVAIGASFNDDSGSNAGHVRVYQNTSDVWTQVGSDIDGEAASDESGYSVSLSSDGSIVAIGANKNDDNGTESGHVRVYKNVSGVWTQIGGDIDGETAQDGSGYSISLSANGTIVAIGAPQNDGNGANSGHVRMYQNISDVWTQIGTDIDGEVAGDWSGLSVSLSSDGGTVASGALFSAGNGSNSGHVRVFDISGLVLSSGEFQANQEIITLYPNPSSNIITISANVNSITVIDITGKKVIESNQSTFNIEDLTNGMYLLEIITDNGVKVIKRLIKE